MLTKEYLNTLFDYNNGMLFWKVKIAPCISIGERAGTLKNDVGYRQVRISGVGYYEHRIIWMMHHGAIPEGIEIDHENRIRDDNRIENLRPLSPTLNQLNTTEKSNNRYGLKGASFHKRDQKWFSSIRVNGNRIYLGYFDTPEDARAAYLIAKDKYHKPLLSPCA